MQEALCRRRPQLPVIFITAFCTEAIRKQAMTSGAIAFLCKPVDGGQIEHCLTGIARGLARSLP
jgi:FixJ family two-component response regulator